MFRKKKTEQTNITGYNKDKKELNINYRKIADISLVVLVIVFIISGVVFYLYQEKNKVKEATKINEQCEALVTADGKSEGLAPFKPVVKSKLLFTPNIENAICEWKFNGENAGATKPFNGYCVKDSLAYYTVGKTTVTLSVKGTTCVRNIDLTVTGLSEEQKQADLKVKVTEPPANAIKETSGQ